MKGYHPDVDIAKKLARERNLVKIDCILLLKP